MMNEKSRKSFFEKNRLMSPVKIQRQANVNPEHGQITHVQNPETIFPGHGGHQASAIENHKSLVPNSPSSKEDDSHARLVTHVYPKFQDVTQEDPRA